MMIVDLFQLRKKSLVDSFQYRSCQQFITVSLVLFIVVNLFRLIDVTNYHNRTILSTYNNSFHPITLHLNNSRSLIICGRQLPFAGIRPYTAPVFTNKIVVIGHDTMNHVQTNNHINSIFHASDYAFDIGAHLVIFDGSWAQRSLTMLFGDSHLETVLENWGIFMIKNQQELDDRFPRHLYEVLFNKSDDMYYYHSSAPVGEIIDRRDAILSYLWSHPRQGENSSPTNRDMCSVVEALLTPDETYAVVHSRWMTNNGCLGRMGSMAARLKKVQSDLIPFGVELDRKAPCLLSTSYIKNIVQQNMFYGKRIFIITDGKNPDIIKDLKADEDIGSYIQTIPDHLRWVGGDMMLAVLSNLFVGSPISTLAGNVARARVALGFNSSTNYLFPMKRGVNESLWTFFCGKQCLYDPMILKNYVG